MISRFLFTNLEGAGEHSLRRQVISLEITEFEVIVGYMS